MKVKTFMRTTFGLFGIAMTAINLYLSNIIVSVTNPFVGGCVFIFFFSATGIATIIAYFNVTRHLDLEEEI